MIRRTFLVVLVLGVFSALSWAVPVNPPVKFGATKADRSKIAGQITDIGEDGFTYTDAKGQAQQVKWDEFDAANTLSIYEKVLGKGDAQTWMALGKRLMEMKNGKAPAERAFAKALRLDPKLKEEIDKIRKGEASASTQPGGASTQPGRGGASGRGGGAGAGAGGHEDKGPKIEENPKLKEWPKLTDLEQQEAVKELKSFAEKAVAISPDLKLYETKFFLFYSDLASHEADKWAGLLDRMYDRLTDTFAISKSDNIWRGKALVLVFSKEDDYMKFQKDLHRTDAEGSAGICHGFGNGDVHIAFYRQPNDMDFAHVLVHESTHGFLHRYRSPKRVVSWANEGLAEWVAAELVPREGENQSELARARSELQNRKSLGNFFTTQHIEGWQYPVARTMTQFMIQKNRKGYADFIKGIKDGMTAEESLKKNLGATPQQLGMGYAKEMGITGWKEEGAGQEATGTGETGSTGPSGGTGTSTGTGTGPGATQNPPAGGGNTGRGTGRQGTGRQSGSGSQGSGSGGSGGY